MAFLIGGANSAADTGYDIENSWRGNGSNSYFNRTLETPTSRRIWTFSAWTKRVPGTNSNLISFGPTAQLNDFRFNSNDSLAWHIDDAVNGSSTQLTPTRLFRDPSAWMHIVLAVDTTQGTDTNRAKIYINNVQQTLTSVFPAEDYDFPGLLADQVTQVGTRTGNDFGYTTGYLADVAFVDGTQLTPSSFGEADEDSGIWKPKEPDVTWGNSGFFLEFKQTGTSADASGKGADTSGNGNHFDDNNADAYDITTDTPTNNFATINSIWAGLSARVAPTLTEGNTQVDHGSTDSGAWSTIIPANGKWYAEFKATNTSSNTMGIAVQNLIDGEANWRADTYQNAKGYMFFMTGNTGNNGGYTTSYGSAWSDDDIIGVAMDLTNGKLYFAINNTWQNSGDPTSGATGTGAAYSIDAGDFHALGSGYKSDLRGQWNFGNPPYANSSDAADADGYGAFEFAPPSGYFALCTKNLAEYG